MLVKEHMNKFPICIGKHESIDAAAKVMHDNNIRHMPVLDDGKLVGLLSNTDIMRAMPSKVTTLEKREATYLFSMVKVKDALPDHQDVITINDDACIEEAALLMRSYKIGCLPVLNNGKLVGIITESDIFDLFLDLLGVRNSGSRLSVRISDEPGEVAKVAEVIRSFGANITKLAMFPIAGPPKCYDLIIRTDAREIQPIAEALRVNGFSVDSSAEYSQVFSHIHG